MTTSVLSETQGSLTTLITSVFTPTVTALVSALPASSKSDSAEDSVQWEDLSPAAIFGLSILFALNLIIVFLLLRIMVGDGPQASPRGWFKRESPKWGTYWIRKGKNVPLYCRAKGHDVAAWWDRLRAKLKRVVTAAWKTVWGPRGSVAIGGVHQQAADDSYTPPYDGSVRSDDKWDKSSG